MIIPDNSRGPMGQQSLLSFRAMSSVVGALLVSGCNESSQDRADSLANMPDAEEKNLYLRPEALPALPLMEFSESLDSVGSTTSMVVPVGAHYLVRVYSNNGNAETELIRESGKALSEVLEIGLYCIKDYEVSEGQIRIDPVAERVALDLPASARTTKVPRWGYRPTNFYTKNVRPTADELPFIVMFHPNEMGPQSFKEAARLARETNVESLIVTIQLRESDSAVQSPSR